MSSGLVESDVLGSTEPRLWTPPLRELTPETSFGFDVIDFAADVLNHPLDEWQEWLVVHGGELLEDGRPRFRKVLALVARQNGKTELLVVLTLYWLFVESVPLTLGTSTKLATAKEAWERTLALGDAAEALDHLHDAHWSRRTLAEETLFTKDGARYKISPASKNTGRGLTIHRLIIDELRQHINYKCWDAAVPAMNAVRDAQAWLISNAGDDNSIVLNDLRASALREDDPRLGIFEWSAPDGASPLDVQALAQANPSLGRRVDVDGLLGEAKRAVAQGGEVLAGFKTESMCMRVKIMDPAIDADAWSRCLDPGDLKDVQSRVTLCVDVSWDQLHTTLVAAAKLDDGRIRVEVVRAYEGYGCVDKMRRALPGLLKRIKPQTIGWLPNGPAAVLAADLVKKQPPPGVKIAEIRTDTAAACMGLAEQVKSEKIAHSNDQLLNAHVTGAERKITGETWTFYRKGEGHCDAAYALAGAVHLARVTKSLGKPYITLASAG